MKLSFFGVLLLIFVSVYNVNQEMCSPSFKQAIERSMKQSNKVLFYVAVGVSVVMHVDAGSLATGPRTTCLQDPSKYPKIHTFGNTGLLGAIHAALAPLETKLIDFSAYRGENVRITIAKGLRQKVGKANANVLDLCCGVGMSTRALQGAFQDAAVILGVDTSKEMIAMAELLSSDSELAKFIVDKPKRTFYGSCSPDFLVGNAEETNLPGGIFDLVTIMYSFHEVPHHGRYLILREARRLLADGCTLAVIDISPNYEPSPTMLAGEPYVLEYKANIQKQLKAIRGFVDLRYEEVVAGHLFLLFLCFCFCVLANIIFKPLSMIVPEQNQEHPRPTESVSKFKLFLLCGVLPIICFLVADWFFYPWDGISRCCILFIAIGLSGFSTDCLKYFYPKRRPNYDEMVRYDPRDAEQSFPSSHSSYATTAMLLLSLFFEEKFHYAPYTLSPLVVGGLVAYSRVRDRFHYPLDVLVGVLIGIASVMTAYQIWEVIECSFW